MTITTLLEAAKTPEGIEALAKKIAESTDQALHNLIVPFQKVRSLLGDSYVVVQLYKHDHNGTIFYSAGFMDRDDQTYVVYDSSEHHKPHEQSRDSELWNKLVKAAGTHKIAIHLTDRDNRQHRPVHTVNQMMEYLDTYIQ